MRIRTFLSNKHPLSAIISFSATHFLFFAFYSHCCILFSLFLCSWEYSVSSIWITRRLWRTACPSTSLVRKSLKPTKASSTRRTKTFTFFPLVCYYSIAKLGLGVRDRWVPVLRWGRAASSHRLLHDVPVRLQDIESDCDGNSISIVRNA